MSDKQDLKLYDLCIAIHRTSGTTRDLAENLGVTTRTIERRFKQLDELGIKCERTKEFDEDTYTAKLREPLEVVLDNLDRAFGVRPYHRPSTLPADEQAQIINTYDRLLHGDLNHWPYQFFDDDTTREERLRVVIPYAMEHIIQRPFKDLCTKHIDQAKLSNPKNKHYRGSPYQFLTVSYPWLREWEIGRVKGMWKGKAGQERMREAIIWLVEEVLPYPFDDLPSKLSRKDFKRNNLDGLLQQPLFRLSPYAAIEFAYPGRFSAEQFSGKQRKWKGHDGRRAAGKVTRRIIEETLGIPVEDIPHKLTRTTLHDALLQEGISGLQHVFGMKLYDIVDNAYPGRFRRSQFNRCAGHWRGDDGRLRAAEELRMYIEHDLQIPIDDIPRGLTTKLLHDNGFLGMMTDKELGFNGSTYLAVDNAYPGRFKEWQFKDATTKWRGEKGKQNAKEAIQWMVRELGWNLDDVPKRIRATHFRQYNLTGLLASKHLGLRNSPALAIMHAYPNRYSKDDFVTCKGL